MVRRILAAGLGGLLGCVLLFMFDALHWIVFRPRAAFLSVIACGVVTTALAEKLRIVPTQDQVDKKGRPISIFSTDSQVSDSPRNSETSSDTADTKDIGPG